MTYRDNLESSQLKNERLEAELAERDEEIVRLRAALGVCQTPPPNGRSSSTGHEGGSIAGVEANPLSLETPVKEKVKKTSVETKLEELAARIIATPASPVVATPFLVLVYLVAFGPVLPGPNLTFPLACGIAACVLMSARFGVMYGRTASTVLDRLLLLVAGIVSLPFALPFTVVVGVLLGPILLVLEAVEFLRTLFSWLARGTKD